MKYITLLIPESNGRQVEGNLHLGDNPGEASVLWLFCGADREQRLFIDEDLADTLRSFIANCAGSAGD